MQRFRWPAVVAVVLVAAAVGVVAFNAGVSHGLAISAAASTAPPPAVPFGPWAYGWYRPWGFGSFGPVAMLFLWFFAFRFLLWGGLHRRRWPGRNWSDLPPSFDEWHRRAHERMGGPTTASNQS